MIVAHDVKKPKTDDKFMKEALERFSDSQDGSRYNRDAYYEDYEFARLEEQWPRDILLQRQQEGRPHLVINKLPALIRSVVNESRQNKPAIKVSPVDNGADEDTAEVISGIIRSVERGSSAEVAYNTAIEQAVTGGMGFFRIGIDYAHPESFDMECSITRIPNALQVHYDVDSTEFDASDWEYAFISDLLTKRDYNAKYPGAAEIDFEGGQQDAIVDQWINEDRIRVAEYFLRISKTRKILQLEVRNPQTGASEMQIVREDQLSEMAKQTFEMGGIDTQGGTDKELIQAWMQFSGITVKREREADYFEVKRRVMSGVEILEEEDWPGSMIPVCPVWGEEIFLRGRRYFRSMIRSAKDSQMMFNFWRSATTELVALAPRAPWIGPEGFAQGNEAKWSTANTRSHSYLEYKGSEAPVRQAFAGVPAGALQESLNANDDMKAITGIFDSSIGAQSNEVSGKAILARERQGDVSNFHFIDNLSRAIRYAGQILVEIIPAVYSPRETVRILGEDQAEKVIKLTQESNNKPGRGGDNQPKLYNLMVGKYDVTVSTGPSFATEREETRETLIQIMRAVPDAAPFIGDVLLDHMDFVGADKISKRLRHVLPPEIRAMEDAETDLSDNPEAAALQQQMKMKEQQIKKVQKAVMQEINKLKQENEALKLDKTIERDKLKMEYTLKDRELKLKEGQAQASPLGEAVKLGLAEEKMEFDADQNERDRQVDLAKTIFTSDDPLVVSEDHMDSAMAESDDILSDHNSDHN